MATQVNKAHLCISQDIGPELSVQQLHNLTADLIRQGRGHYKVQIDDDQLGDPVDVKSMQVFDGDNIVEFTHS
jgi:hypothetical protein